MKRTITKVGVAGLLSLGLLAPSAALAAEAPPATPDEPTIELPAGPRAAKMRCFTAINRRLVALERAERHVERHKAVTEEHEAALLTILEDTSTSLKEVRAAVRAAETRDEVVALCETVVTEHYVYRLVVPQVRAVLAADRLGAIADRVAARSAKLADKLAELEAAGVDVAEASALLATADGSIASASGGAARAADSVLALTVEDVSTGQVDETFGLARDALAGARTDLREATAIQRQVIALVRAADDDLADDNAGDETPGDDIVDS